MAVSYGFCPRCASPGVRRERRPDGNDTCERGCVYPSASSTNEPMPPRIPPPPLTRDDLDLIDALVWAGVLSRSVAREVATCAQPGRVATYISEKGLAPAIHPPQVIIRALAQAEAWSAVDMAAVMEQINRHDFSSRGALHEPIAVCNCKGCYMPANCPTHGAKPETD